MKIRVLLCICMLLYALGGCTAGSPASSQTQLQPVPEDFNFVFVADFMEVDTCKGTIKNTYWHEEGNSDAIADFAFSAHEMQMIYNAFLQYDIARMPQEIDRGKDYMAIPPSYYEITYTLNGETKTVSCGVGAVVDQAGISKDNNNFMKFVTVVQSYVQDSKAYAGLPEGPYLE